MNSKLLRGFTIIELLVVIAIIGILIGFSAINLAGVRQRGRDGQRKADLKAIQSAFELYRTDQRQYPATLPSCGNPLEVGASRYLTAMPCEHRPGWEAYIYTPSGTPPQAYTLTACLENTHDADIVAGAPVCGVSSEGRRYTVNNP